MLVHSLAAAGFRLLRREDGDDGGEENCVYVEPGPNGNVPITACNSYYNYDPQFAPAVAVAVIFGVLTGIHVVEAFIYKKVSAGKTPNPHRNRKSNLTIPNSSGSCGF